MKLFFDFDGVVRNLSYPVFKKHPDSWYSQPWNWQEGYGHFDFINYLTEKPELQYLAPPTEYCRTIFTTCLQLGIRQQYVTCQPATWGDITIKWLDYYKWKYNDYTGSGIHWVEKPREKLKYIGSNNGLLVEDYPFLHSYKRIILIDRPYNRFVEKPYARVKTPKQLEYLLKRLVRTGVIEGDK